MELNKETIQEIESAFKKIQILTIQLDGHEFKMLPLNEIPQKKMIQFMEEKDENKMTMMLEIIQTCAINPTKTKNEIETLTMNQFQTFLSKWVTASQ